MKKIIPIFIIFFLTISTTFGYIPTSKDNNLLKGIYTQLDSILEKSPSKIENLYTKITQIKDQLKEEERIYYIFSELENYSYEILTDRDDTKYIVTKVTDGDTITISYLGKESKVRLIGVDSPESYETRFGYKECYGDEATQYLIDLLEGKEIKLETDSFQGKIDIYGRLLGYVIYNGENINNKLIQEGYAWEYVYDTSYKYQDLFKNSEKEAEENNKGLWASDTCNGKRLNIDDMETMNNNEVEENNDYTCGEKNYCTQMNSCEEAEYYLNSCGLNRLDGDGDGIPCESLCE